LLNERDQDLGLIGEPLLVAKSRKDQRHRLSDEIGVEAFGKQARLRQCVNQRIHRFQNLRLNVAKARN
jgi:hypothetical protein